MLQAAPRATPGEREQLLADFVRLCEIESPSRRERPVADALLADLRSLGLSPSEDQSNEETGCDAGNVLARVPGPGGARTILFCAHMDTVPLAAPVEVVKSEEGSFSNRHEGILGADNKAAVAVFLGVARRFARERPPVGLEFLFTVNEEDGLQGAKAFDVGTLSAEYGFVFDHATPVGDVVLAAPTYFRLTATFRGKAAHAGLRPEAGHNAIEAAARALSSMKLGRLDRETTANAGLIEGGSATNVVAERCRVELEARSLDHARAGEVVSALIDAATAGACEAHCDLETTVEEDFRAYKLTRGAAQVAAAAAALEGVGIEPNYISTGGGSDAHVFNARGLPCVNVANGTEANHEPTERVSTEALETMLDVALGIVAHSA